MSPGHKHEPPLGVSVTSLFQQRVQEKKQQRNATAKNHEAEPAGFDGGPQEP